MWAINGLLIPYCLDMPSMFKFDIFEKKFKVSNALGKYIIPGKAIYQFFSDNL